MAGTRNSNVIAATVLIAIAGLAFVANAVNEDVAASRVPYPDIPKGQGDNCVEDTEFMRRYHMTLLLHQRDDTMLKGIHKLPCRAGAGFDTSYICQSGAFLPLLS
jgi:hypothetical protein